MLTILKRIVLHWRTSLEAISFGSIAWLLTDHGVQLTIQRNDKLIPTLITIGIAIYKLFSTDPVNKPAPEKPDPVIGSQVRNLSLSIILLSALGLSSAAAAQSVVVGNAANFRHAVAPGSIAVAFGGEDFTTVTEEAREIPLPQRLAGVRMLVDRTFVGLFFVSPRQVNFLVPDGLAPGLHTAVVVTPDGRNLVGAFYVAQAAPGVFTWFANGQGEAAANYLRFGDQGCVVLYATGVTTGKASLFLGGREIPAQYAGPAPGYVGLRQLNFLAPISELPTTSTLSFVRVYLSAENGEELHYDSQTFIVKFQ